MKRMLIYATLSLVLCGGLAAPALAKGPKHSPAYNAAVRQCGQAYEAAARAAHAPTGPKGNDRKRAMHAAAEAKKACIANAPK